MTRLKLPACLVSVVGLISQDRLSLQHAGPVVMPGHFALRRGASLTLLGGLTVGTSLVLLGLFAALTTLL